MEEDKDNEEDRFYKIWVCLSNTSNYCWVNSFLQMLANDSYIEKLFVVYKRELSETRDASSKTESLATIVNYMISVRNSQKLIKGQITKVTINGLLLSTCGKVICPSTQVRQEDSVEMFGALMSDIRTEEIFGTANIIFRYILQQRYDTLQCLNNTCKSCSTNTIEQIHLPIITLAVKDENDTITSLVEALKNNEKVITKDRECFQCKKAEVVTSTFGLKSSALIFSLSKNNQALSIENNLIIFELEYYLGGYFQYKGDGKAGHYTYVRHMGNSIFVEYNDGDCILHALQEDNGMTAVKDVRAVVYYKMSNIIDN